MKLNSTILIVLLGSFSAVCQTYRIYFPSSQVLGRYFHATHSPNSADSEIAGASNGDSWPNARIGNWGSDDGLGIISQSSNGLVYLDVSRRRYFRLPSDQTSVNSIPFLVRFGNDSGPEPLNAERWIDLSFNPPVVKDENGDIIFSYSVETLGDEEVIPMGNSRGIDNSFGTKTRLWADFTTGNMSFVHGNVQTTSFSCGCFDSFSIDQCEWFADEGKGMIRYDFSNSGGKVWANNLNYNWSGAPEFPDCEYDYPLYRWPFNFFFPNFERQDSAFYPQALLLPGASGLVFSAPITREINGKWGAYAIGQVQPNSGQGIQSIGGQNTVEPTSSEIKFSTLQDMTVKLNSEVVLVDIDFDFTNNQNGGKVLVHKLNSVNQNSSISSTSIVTLPAGFSPIKAKVTFSDNNNDGYLCIVAKNGDSPNAIASFRLYTTNNGGNTWTELSTPDWFNLGAELGFNNPGIAGDFDLELDANSVLHIALNIGQSAAYSDLPDWGQGDFKIVDLRYDAENVSWSYFILSNSPKTVKIGPYGSGSLGRYDSNRLQISKNQDRSKLYFVFTDVANESNLSLPNAQARGFDVASNKWTQLKDITSSTTMRNRSHFLDIASNSIVHNGVLFTPATYIDMENIDQYNIESDDAVSLHRFLEWIRFGDSEFVIEEVVTSIESDYNKPSFASYNQSNNTVMIRNQFFSDNTFIYRILDLSGRVVHEGYETPKGANADIQLSTLSNGIYLLQVQHDNQIKVFHLLVSSFQ